MDQDKHFGFWPLSGRDLLMLMQLLVIVPHAGHLPVTLSVKITFKSFLQ